MGAKILSGDRSSVRRILTTIAVLAFVASIAQPASAGTAKKVAFGVQPVTTTAGRLIPAVTVQIVDQQNRVVTDSTLPVTVALGTNPSGGTLYGTQTVNAVAGVATFGTLRIDKAGSYTLAATSPGLIGATSSSFAITGASAICDANGCTVSDPNGNTPTKSNSTTGTIQVTDCPGAGANTDFLSYDESSGNFCNGDCLGAAIFFASECTEGQPWLIIYRLDKSALPTDKGAAHINMYIETSPGVGSLIPDCVKQGVIGTASICVSRQYKNGQGDSVTEILKLPGDPRIAG
jgi:hypothetical protein